MSSAGWKIAAIVGLALAIALPPSFTLDAAQAQDRSHDKVYVMKIAIPTVGDATDQFSKNFATAVERDSGGRIKPQVYPASQLGSIQRMIEGTQFGAIECVSIPPEFFVGIDERFEVMAAPGLVDSMEQAQRLAADPTVLKLILGLGADKGLHGIGMLTANLNELVARTPINHIAAIKGKKIRVFASQLETVPFARLGATPVAMTLADVLPALQQGAIDGALAGIPILAAMHFKDAAKYVTHIGQPTVFGMVEVSKKWFDTLPPDLQQVVEKDAAKETVAINPVADALIGKAFAAWTAGGGVVIDLPHDEYASLIHTLSATAEEVAERKPSIAAAYQIVREAAQRAH